MRRAPIVITATIAGLAGILEFHTRPATLNSDGVIGRSTPARSTAAASTTSGSASSRPAGSASPSPSTSRSSTRTVTGTVVDYNYGSLSVTVSVSGSKITDVGIASLDDGGNIRSQSIDEEAIPVLEEEAVRSQGADIQSVSGASYTSEGFIESLQSALDSLGRS